MTDYTPEQVADKVKELYESAYEDTDLNLEVRHKDTEEKTGSSVARVFVEMGSRWRPYKLVDRLEQPTSVRAIPKRRQVITYNFNPEEVNEIMRE